MATAPRREADSILRMREVVGRCGLNRATIYRKIAKGLFPPGIPLSFAANGRVAATGWYESDINAWVADPTGWRPGDVTALKRSVG